VADRLLDLAGIAIRLVGQNQDRLPHSPRTHSISSLPRAAASDWVGFPDASSSIYPKLVNLID
jgi:hypothetical protein